MNHFYHKIHGWFDYEEIYDIAIGTASDGARFVEIGAWKGKSAAYAGVEIMRSKKKIKLDVIDHFLGSEDHRDPRSKHFEPLTQYADGLYNLCKLNLNPVKKAVNIIRSDSMDAVKTYEDESLDFCFIDGSHDYESVCKDIDAWLPKIKTSGILAGHDYRYYEGVRKAVNEKLEGAQPIGASWIYYKKGV